MKSLAWNCGLAAIFHLGVLAAFGSSSTPVFWQWAPINFDDPRLLGPFFSQDLIDLDEARVYLMDGVFLGTVGSLKVKRRRYFKLRPEEQ